MPRLGAEIAKNIILAGISSVTLCDPELTNSYDLGGNFYLGENNVGSGGGGKGRAELCRDKLASLNEYVKVTLTSFPTRRRSGLKQRVYSVMISMISSMGCVRHLTTLRHVSTSINAVSS
jgi:hypothetical protein